MTTESTISTPEKLPQNAERIMGAAIRLFAQKGYAATSVREIVQEAQVTNPMLYYYFDNKETLFERTLNHLMRYRHENVAAIVQSSVAFRSKLRALVELHFESLRENPYILQFIYAVLFGPRESRPDYDIRCEHDDTVDQVAEIFRQAQAASEFEPNTDDYKGLADRFIGLIGIELMRGLKTLEVLPESEAERYLDEMTGPDAVENLVDFFLNGAGRAR